MLAHALQVRAGLLLSTTVLQLGVSSQLAPSQQRRTATSSQESLPLEASRVPDHRKRGVVNSKLELRQWTIDTPSGVVQP